MKSERNGQNVPEKPEAGPMKPARPGSCPRLGAGSLIPGFRAVLSFASKKPMSNVEPGGLAGGLCGYGRGSKR